MSAETPSPFRYSSDETSASPGLPAASASFTTLFAASFSASSLSGKLAASERRDGTRAFGSRNGSERRVFLPPLQIIAPGGRALRVSASWARGRRGTGGGGAGTGR